MNENFSHGLVFKQNAGLRAEYFMGEMLSVDSKAL